MNHTCETGKKTSFGPKFRPKNYFHRFCLCYMLDIVASYHCIQFQGKITSQTRENGKNLVLGLILAYLNTIWAQKFFIVKFTATTS